MKLKLKKDYKTSLEVQINYCLSADYSLIFPASRLVVLFQINSETFSHLKPKFRKLKQRIEKNVTTT